MSSLPSASTTSAPEARSRPDSCAARVAIFRKRLGLANTRPLQIGVEDAIELPRVPRVLGRQVPEAPMVAVWADHETVDGQRPAKGLAELLERKRELWKSFHPGKEKDEWTVVLQASGDLSAVRLATVATTVGKHGWTPWLMVRGPDFRAIPSDPPPWVVELLAEIRKVKDIPRSTQLLADGVRRAQGHCEATREVFQSISGPDVDPSKKYSMLAKDLPDAVVACRCKLDVDGLEALLVAFNAGDDLRHEAVRIPLDAAGATHRQASRGTVQALAESLVQGAPPTLGK